MLDSSPASMEKGHLQTLVYRMDSDSSSSLPKPPMFSPVSKVSKRPSFVQWLLLLRGKRTPTQRGVNISTPRDFKHVSHISFDEKSNQFIVRLSKSIVPVTCNQSVVMRY